MKTEQEILKQLKFEQDLLKSAERQNCTNMVINLNESINVLKWVLEQYND